MDRKERRKSPENFCMHNGITFNLHNISILHIKTLDTETLSHFSSSSLSIHALDKYLLISYLSVTGTGKRWTCKTDVVPVLKDLRVQHAIKHDMIETIVAYLTN